MQDMELYAASGSALEPLEGGCSESGFGPFDEEGELRIAALCAEEERFAAVNLAHDRSDAMHEASDAT